MAPTIVTCVRCGKTLPLERADIVGNGYRCAACTSYVQHAGEEEEVVDNVAPEERERLARQGKRRFAAAVGGASAAIGVPAAIAFAASGVFGALVAGLAGAYLGATWLSATGETNYAQWKRYRQPPLPKAKLRR